MTKPSIKAAPAASSALNGGAFALLTTVKAIDAAIAEIHEKGQTIQTLMHQTACSVLSHVGKHKDVRIAMRMVAAMPEMSRKNSLIQWFDTFGPMKFQSDGTCIYVPDGKTRLGDAIAKPFWKFKANEGMPYEPLDMTKYVDAQVKKLQTDQDKTGTDHSVVIAALRAAKHAMQVAVH